MIAWCCLTGRHTHDRAQRGAGMTARWPALMDRQTLAEYLCCSVPMLDKEVARCNIPPPVKFAGRDKWRKDDIDRALANLTGEAVPEWERRFLEGKAA